MNIKIPTSGADMFPLMPSLIRRHRWTIFRRHLDVEQCPHIDKNMGCLIYFSMLTCGKPPPINCSTVVDADPLCRRWEFLSVLVVLEIDSWHPIGAFGYRGGDFWHLVGDSWIMSEGWVHRQSETLSVQDRHSGDIGVEREIRRHVEHGQGWWLRRPLFLSLASSRLRTQKQPLVNPLVTQGPICFD